MKSRLLSVMVCSFAVLFSAFVLAGRLLAAETSTPLSFFVSLQGNDNWSGELERPLPDEGDGPFCSLEAARDAVRKLSLRQRQKQTIEICLLPGTHIRQAPLLLETQDSGTAKAPIVYRAWTDEPTVISGGKEVHKWNKTQLNGHPVLVADLSKLSEGYTPFEQLWVNGHRATQARTLNRGYLQIPSVPKVEQDPAKERRAKTYEFSYAPTDEPYFDGVQDGVAVIFNKWLEYHMPLDRVDREQDRIICSKQSGRALEIEDHYYLEGGRAMLDQPGEWYLDREKNKLYYYPLAEESEVVAVIPSLVNVLRIEGDVASGQWVEHIQFRGLTFSHTTWILPRDSGPSGYGQADIQMDGAVRLEDARYCLFEECEITAVGNYGLEIATGCFENRILGCDIHDLGGGGLLIGAKIRPRGPKSGYQPGEKIPPVLKHPSDATSHNEIADCRIYDGGRYYHCAVGIWIGQSPDNNVHHNEIYDFYYSAISSGWTWGYGSALATGNRFEYNHIHHIGQRRDGDGRVLSDMGGIYTLGDQAGTVIRNNVFNDIYAGKYGGWAIYFDEGTRNILAENNLVYRCRHSCFNQHYGKDNIVRNNIFAFSDTSVVCLAKAESHTSFILTNNIFLSDGPPMYAGGYAYDVNMPGKFKADRNLAWSTNGTVLGAQNRFPSRIYEPDEPVLTWQEWQALGYDPHTVIADPGFIDPANGDFHLSEDSPASQIGFKPFPLNEAGPRIPGAPSADAKTTHAITPVVIESEVTSIMADKWGDAFQHVEYPQQWLDNVITVNPGDDIQSAIDSAHSVGGGIVFLKAGTHILDRTITLKGKVTIAGEGRTQTVLLQGPDMKSTAFNVEANPQVTDLVIKDLTLKGTRSGKANGILIRGRNESRHTRVMLQNITVSDWSAQGVHMKRTNNIIMDKCDIQYNGSAGGLYHNVYFLYNKYLLQSDCDMSFPVKGKGNKYTSCEYVLAQRCTIRDSKVNGIQADHEEAGFIFFHKYHISGCGRVALWFPCEHYYDKYTYTENPKYAPQHVILNRCTIVNNTWGAMWRAVNDSYVINCHFANKKIDMGLLKCDVTIENSTFSKGNEFYTDVKQWPSDVKILW